MFIPLEDDAPRRKFPFINTLVILANLGVFVWYALLHPGYEQVVRDYGFMPAHWTWQSVFAYMFLHADLMHLCGNLLFLAVVGDNVEDRFGHVAYLFYYVFCGIAAIVTQALFQPALALPVIGASGAVSGIMGAFLVLFPFARIKMLFLILPMRVPAFLFIGVWAGMQWMLKLQQDEHPMSSPIAVWAHIGGFVFGFCVTLLLRMTARKSEPSKD